MRQRSDNLFKILDDAPLQASLDDLDQTFSELKQQIQVSFMKIPFTNVHFFSFYN